MNTRNECSRPWEILSRLANEAPVSKKIPFKRRSEEVRLHYSSRSSQKNRKCLGGIGNEERYVCVGAVSVCCAVRMCQQMRVCVRVCGCV